MLTEYVNKTVSIHALVRVRLECSTLLRTIRCFNPRTRESATGEKPDGWTKPDVSIHALVRVRPLNHRKTIDYDSFNPRTRESATMGFFMILF